MKIKLNIRYWLLKKTPFDIFALMKKFTKKIIIIPAIALFIIIALVLVFDKVIMPWYVEAPETVLPELVGMPKDEAIKILTELNLNPIEEGPRYDSRYEKDHVIYQNPHSGTLVKENRRIYLFISGGEPLVKVPNLIGKTLRDAKITIERIGLQIGEVEEIRSEFPSNSIVQQEIEEGTNLPNGSTIDIKVSVGPKIGMLRVPSLLGKSLREAENLLRKNSLRVGKINYLDSPTLLPNTIIDQYPSENKLISVGDSVDVVVTKN